MGGSFADPPFTLFRVGDMAAQGLFLTIAEVLGSAVGADATVGGYIAGLILVVSIMLSIALFTRSMKADVMVVASAIGAVAATIIGWFDVWVIIFFALIAIFIFARPFGGAFE